MEIKKETGHMRWKALPLWKIILGGVSGYPPVGKEV
jgi:hypothetical protein